MNRPWHKRFHSDALAGFQSLNLEQRGAYQTILDLLYDRGEPIKDNERLLSGYMNCSIRKWRSMRSQLIEMGKIFITDNGRISNIRFEKSLENDAKTSRKQAENVSKRWRDDHETHKNVNENNDPPIPPYKSGNTYQIPDTRYQKTTLHTREDLDLLESKLRDAGGNAMDASAPGLLDLSHILSCLNAGCDLEMDILPAIRASVANRQPGRLRTWGYFTEAIAEHHVRRMTPAVLPSKARPRNAYETKKSDYDEFKQRIAARIESAGEGDS